jgi:hypothetical protein
MEFIPAPDQKMQCTERCRKVDIGRLLGQRSEYDGSTERRRPARRWREWGVADEEKSLQDRGRLGSALNQKEVRLMVERGRNAVCLEQAKRAVVEHCDRLLLL